MPVDLNVKNILVSKYAYDFCLVHCEKTCFLYMQKPKRQTNCSDSTFVFHCLDSRIPLDSKTLCSFPGYTAWFVFNLV